MPSVGGGGGGASTINLNAGTTPLLLSIPFFFNEIILPTHVRDEKILTFSTLDVRVEEDDNFGGGVLEAHTAARLGSHSLRGSQDSNLGVPRKYLSNGFPRCSAGRGECAIRTAGSGRGLSSPAGMGGGGGSGGRNR